MAARADDWRRYLAPAAFLLAVTVAVVLVRAGIQSGKSSSKPPPTVPASASTSTSTATFATTATTTKKTPPRRFWTVRAGDTFGVISAQTGVPVTTIEQLNPNVKSTSLFIGEKIRIR